MFYRNFLIFQSANLLRKLGFSLSEKNDPRVARMQKEIQQMGKIEFVIEQYDDGSWTAESINVDGIITGGDNVQKAGAGIRDAVFTYYSIPPHLCNSTLLKADNEPALLKGCVYA